MTTRQIIDEITRLNPTATLPFLAKFEDEELKEYLRHLRWVRPDGGPELLAGSAADAAPTHAPIHACLT